MRKYAKYDADGALLGIGTGAGGVEISAEEYDRLLAKIRTIAEMTNAVYTGRITLDDVPDDLRQDVENRVNARMAEQAEIEATEADYIAALGEMGVDLSDEG